MELKKERNLKGLQIYLTSREYLVDQATQNNARLQQEVQIFQLGLVGRLG